MVSISTACVDKMLQLPSFLNGKKDQWINLANIHG